VLLMDEPFSALDEMKRGELGEWLGRAHPTAQEVPSCHASTGGLAGGSRPGLPPPRASPRAVGPGARPRARLPDRPDSSRRRRTSGGSSSGRLAPQCGRPGCSRLGSPDRDARVSILAPGISRSPRASLARSPAERSRPWWPTGRSSAPDRDPQGADGRISSPTSSASLAALRGAPSRQLVMPAAITLHWQVPAWPWSRSVLALGDTLIQGRDRR
jgi:hypothetical protein